MRLLQVCSEIFPILKTGGLADVTGALPDAFKKIGIDTRVVLPGFRAITQALTKSEVVAEIPSRFGAPPCRLLKGQLKGLNVVAYVIDCPYFYDRNGGPYADEHQRPWPDNHMRFALLGWVAARLTQTLDPRWRPDVVHAHDWHAGLTAAYLHAFEHWTGIPRIPCVFTIHNLAYQGNFAAHCFAEVDLPLYMWGVNGVEFHGQLSFMKAGLFYADQLTTVSPTYAQEIQGAEQGVGFDGLLRGRRDQLTGILNGVDPLVWNPATDAHLAAQYDHQHLAGKMGCKAALQAQLQLAPKPDAPLFCVVSRLTHQKGLHLVLEALPQLIQAGAQFALLGGGEHGMEVAFRQLAQAHPQSVAVRIGYDEPFAHQLIAGSDMICVPSLYEPCGLTQMYGLQYGTVPLVRKVGGLADTVVHCDLEGLVHKTATGFVFDHFSSHDLLAVARQAMALYKHADEWQALQQRGMKQSFDWQRAAKAYQQVYQRATKVTP